MRELDYFRNKYGLMPAKIYIDGKPAHKQAEIMFWLRRFAADKRDYNDIDYLRWLDSYVAITTTFCVMVMSEQKSDEFLILVGFDTHVKLSASDIVSRTRLGLEIKGISI